MTSKLSLELLEGKYAVVKLAPDAPVPAWALNGEFYSITRTSEELSLVCPESNLTQEVEAERDWRIFKIEGVLDFSLVGVLAALASVLAKAGVSIFAISTFNTDYILVKQTALERAVRALKAEGYHLA
jgi:hypothetical protein